MHYSDPIPTASRLRHRDVGHRATARALLCVALLLGLSSCKTVPPPPPAPVEVPAQPPQAPPVFVRVTGSRLNVRESASSTAAVVTKLKRGDRLQLLAESSGWVQVKLPDGAVGWVSAQFVRKDLPCMPDKLTAEVLNEPPISLVEGVHGRIVVDATVNADGVVTATKVVQNTTGIPELGQKAIDEVRLLKFAPPVRHCKPIPFIYTYSRSY